MSKDNLLKLAQNDKYRNICKRLLKNDDLWKDLYYHQGTISV